MRGYSSALFSFVAFTLGTLPAGAQDAKSVEVTPYVALASEMASPVGASITFPITSKLNFETDVAYRRAEGDISALSLSAGLLYDLPRIGQATPYVAGGVGLTNYGAPIFSSSGRPIATQSRMAMTVNAGGGLKIPMNEKLEWRSDARWGMLLGRHGQGSAEFFRVAQGISFPVGKR